MTDNLLTTEPQTSNVPAGIPSKFWDADTQQIRTEALLASYLALEKKLGQMVPMPSTDDDKLRLLKLLGCPDTPDQYDVKIKNDFLSLDPDLNARLHAKGFTSEQVQEVYDLATEKLVPLILEMATEFQADREIERLVDEFGGVEKWQEIARQLNEYGAKTLPRGAFEGLACSYDGVMALYNMMKSGIQKPVARVEGAVAEAMDENALRGMMQNPKYWRERNPAYIARVTEGFQNLYGRK